MFFQVIDILQEIDEWFMDILNGRNTPFLTSFMTLYTGKIIWGFLYLSLAVILFINLNFKYALTVFVSIILVILIADQSVSTFIRPLVERPRPCNPESPVYDSIFKIRTSKGFGFPSCHAANSFGLAMSVYYIFRKKYLVLFFFTWAIVNSYTRIYLGMHYPGDILVGFAVGTFAAYLLHLLNVFVLKYIYKNNKYENLPKDRLKFLWLPVCVGLCTIITIVFISLLRI